jgi:endonuclease YncB( thermonuclease family)
MAIIALQSQTLHEIRVIDGDTIEAWLDFSDVVRIKRRIRLRGIEGGELAELCGRRARRQLEVWLTAKAHQTPKLTGNLNHLDQHGRIVADVTFDTGESLVAMCLQSGIWWRRTRDGSQPGARLETAPTKQSAQEKHQ